MPLFPWCTGTQNILGQLNVTFSIHLITMVGQAIHGGAATHVQKEPFVAIVWTHFENFMRGAIVFNSADDSTCTSVDVSSVSMSLIQ